MGIGTNVPTAHEERPLNRADVEKMLREVGGSENLVLVGQNMRRIDLSSLHLSRANLSKTHLYGANLSETNLREANLSGANLSGANLREAELSGTNLIRAKLFNVNLYMADLHRANLSRANLSMAKLLGADLSGADLRGADLQQADLRGADLREADLRGADLNTANLEMADLRGAFLLEETRAALLEKEVTGLKWIEDNSGSGLGKMFSTLLSLRLMEDPLTASTLTTVLSSFTELHTKCWLIQQARFADLMDYTQTHNQRFVEEAGLIIAHITHHSPALFDFSHLGPKEVAEALQTGIDAIAQAGLRRKEAELHIQALTVEIQTKTADLKRKEEEIQTATQQDQLMLQKAQLELEKEHLALERDQLTIQRERLELEQQRLIFAWETAAKMIERLYAGSDPATKALLIQSLLPGLLQLGNGMRLEIPRIAEPPEIDSADVPSEKPPQDK